MRRDAVLSKNISIPERRARSVTPGLLNPKHSKMNTINFETFFRTENVRLPGNATLLPKDSEKVEFITQLKLLKFQLNKSAFETTSIEKALNKSKFELFKTEYSEKLSESRLKSLGDKFDNLEKEETKIKNDFKDALIDFNSYIHLKERMNLTLIFLERKSNDLKQKLFIRNDVLKVEKYKRLKTAESNGRNRKQLKELYWTSEYENKKRNILNDQLEKDITSKQNLAMKREDMKKRRVEIVDAVANEDKNQRNNFLREGMLLHKAWFHYLNGKLIKDSQQFQFIEKAYANIRSLTGLSVIQEVVEKILTKEESYTSLMKMILESKKVCEKYRQRNIDLENEMNEIVVSDKNNSKTKATLADSNIEKSLKQISIAKGRLSKLKICKSFIESWLKNICRKVEIKNTDEFDLKTNFWQLKNTISSKITVHEYTKITYETYPLRYKKKKFSLLENLKVNDLVQTVDDDFEIILPNEKSVKKKFSKK